jgi:hypothetical protein
LTAVSLLGAELLGAVVMGVVGSAVLEACTTIVDGGVLQQDVIPCKALWHDAIQFSWPRTIARLAGMQARGRCHHTIGYMIERTQRAVHNSHPIVFRA